MKYVFLSLHPYIGLYQNVRVLNPLPVRLYIINHYIITYLFIKENFMQLYERIETGKRVSYKPHNPYYTDQLLELEQEQVISLLTTFTLAMLMSVSAQCVSHSRAAREIRKVEEAIIGLAKLNPKGIDETTILLGTKAWNSAIKSIAEDF
jgi:hypothetical protein